MYHINHSDTGEVISEGNVNANIKEITFGILGGFLCLLPIIVLVVVLLIRRKG